MSIQNRLFNIIVSEFKTSTDYKSLKSHINDVFYLFNGNKLNPSKLDKYASLLFGANNPNIIGSILERNAKINKFDIIKGMLINSFSKCMLNKNEKHFKNSNNVIKANVFSFFIPIYKNNYFEIDNNISKGNFYIGIRIILAYENGVDTITFHPVVYNENDRHYYCYDLKKCFFKDIINFQGKKQITSYRIKKHEYKYHESFLELTNKELLYVLNKNFDDKVGIVNEMVNQIMRMSGIFKVFDCVQILRADINNPSLNEYKIS